MYGLCLTANRLLGSNLSRQTVQYSRNVRRRKKTIDPGIQQRKVLLSDDQEFEQLNDYDFDLEADFMNTVATYKEHKHEQHLKEEQQKYLIVKQKYFKEKMPNFLTWSDKEQIRYLHNTNPEEWSIEKLSESFPALPDSIAKLVKSTWTKKRDKLQNHDESVKRNWSAFNEGSLAHLPSDLRDHLKKFTNRNLNLKLFEVPKEITKNTCKDVITPNNKMKTEFSDIIKSYQRLKKKDKDDQNDFSADSKLRKPPKQDTYLLGNNNSRQNNKHTTLENLQHQKQKYVEDESIPADEPMLQAIPEDQSIDDKIILHTEKKPTLTLKLDTDSNVMGKKFASTAEVDVVRKFDQQLNFLEYPEKIFIPKSKFKRGYTYKLNDCYYDDDGEFLYRVPGMYT